MKKTFWVILILTLLTGSCDDRIEDPDKSNIIVTMLRVSRIEILDNLWITPAPIWGHLESDNVSFTNNYTLIQISGFPYSASSAGVTGFVVYSEDWAGDAPEFIQHAADTRGYIMYGAGGQSYLDDSDFTSGSNDNNNQMTFYITYYV